VIAPAPPHPEWIYDWPTLVAITLVVFAVSTVLHEGVGHGSACLITGGQARVVSTVHFECSSGNRLVMAGGTLVNLLAGLLCLGLLHRLRRAPVTLRYFLWLSMTINLLRAAGYFLYSGIGNIGDWAEFIQGLGPPWAWRILLTLIGGITYWLFVRLSLAELLPFIGAGDRGRVARAHRLTLDAYLAGGIFECIAGLFNPVGMLLVAISAAAAAFGGGSGLAWMSQLLRGRRFPEGPGALPLKIARSWTWIAGGTVVAGVYIGILGPGIRLS
jgi:hypothetical protein